MDKTARIVVGLGFGDESKGSMVDFICRNFGSDLVVRFNGGSQAAHNVVTDDGKHHTFAQIGSGAFIPGIRTLISRYMFWDPVALACEVNVLAEKIKMNPLDHHYIDERAPIITPFHLVANRVREWLRGENCHGSCGKGCGEAVYDSISFPDQMIFGNQLGNFDVLVQQLRLIQAQKLADLRRSGLRLEDQLPTDIDLHTQLLFDSEAPARIAEAYVTMAKEHFNLISASQANRMIAGSKPCFEAAQGVLLDEWRGFHPYTTWSTTTQKNALMLIEESGFPYPVETIGVTRAYATRHGAGPFITEGVGGIMPAPNENNDPNDWQHSFRVGCFDTVMLKYAIECVQAEGKLSSIALTHLDLFCRNLRVPFCDQYLTPEGAVQEIPLGQAKDLAYQEALTEILKSTKPVLGGYFKDPIEMVDCVERISGVPVGYTSSGPTSGHKKIIGPR